LGEKGVDRWEDNIKIDRKEIGFIWLRIGTSSGLFRTS
jgi:hypothetical protein